MSSVLIIQKDTLEEEKVKALLTVCNEDPHLFTSTLQEGHCIPYQLIAHSVNNKEMAERISIIANPFKTDHGKNWYAFDHKTIAEIISLYIEYNQSWINIQSISDIIGFDFKMYPVVRKEIKISNIPSVASKIHKQETNLKVEAIPLENKDEIIEQIFKLEQSNIKEKRIEKSEKYRRKKDKERR